jgi:hypothetical protein
MLISMVVILKKYCRIYCIHSREILINKAANKIQLRKNKKKGVGEGAKHYLQTTAAGNPLVGLTFGSEINWKLLYFSRNVSVH